MKNFNKLVRDLIPEIIEKNNQVPKFRILDEDNYKKALLNKLIEESVEVREAFNNRDELIKEIGDLLEVIEYLIKVFSLDVKEIENLRQDKKNKRGGFDKRIFLESVD